MTFEEWFDYEYPAGARPRLREAAKRAWSARQLEIDELKKRLKELEPPVTFKSGNMYVGGKHSEET